jgi:hypothetical protein
VAQGVEAPRVRDGMVEGYRLISIDPSPSPTGEASDDWLVYRIVQGRNLITGYRRGSRQAVTAEVERIVIALNDRLLVRGQPYRSAGRPPKAAAAHDDVV